VPGFDQGADFRIQVQEEAPAKPADPKLAAFLDAVRSTDTEAVEKLIASDPQILKGKDRTGSTALHHAAGFGSYAMVKLLLDKGADPNAANRRKSTPLFWAISDESKVRLLIDRGANIDARLAEGRTLVYQAASLGYGMPLLRLLLEKDAKPGRIGCVSRCIAPDRVSGFRLSLGAGALSRPSARFQDRDV